MSTDHRTDAEQLLAGIARGIDGMTALSSDLIAMSLDAQAATAHALLAIEARLAELVEGYQVVPAEVVTDVVTDETGGLSALAATIAELRAELDSSQQDAAMVRAAHCEQARRAEELRKRLEVAERRADAKGE